MVRDEPHCNCPFNPVANVLGKPSEFVCCGNVPAVAHFRVGVVDEVSVFEGGAGGRIDDGIRYMDILIV